MECEIITNADFGIERQEDIRSKCKVQDGKKIKKGVATEPILIFRCARLLSGNTTCFCGSA
jgi:hypothetical protein